MRSMTAYEMQEVSRNGRQLGAIWESVVGALVMMGEDPRTGQAVGKVAADHDEAQFRLGGVACYARFGHNLDRGVLEYGFLAQEDMGSRARIPVETLTVTRQGEVRGSGLEGLAPDAEGWVWVHEELFKKLLIPAIRRGVHLPESQKTALGADAQPTESQG